MKLIKIIVNEKAKEIVLGYSVYNMERPKDKKDLMSLLDKEKCSLSFSTLHLQASFGKRA